MKSMVIRFTGNKREVGILKSELKNTSQVEDEHIIDRGKSVREMNHNKISLKFKCFDKHRDFNETPTPVKTGAFKPDLNNNTEMLTAHKVKASKKLNDVKKKNSKLIKRNLVKAKPWNKNWAKRRRQQKQERKKKESERKCSIQFGKSINKNSNWDSDSSGGESRRKHPNRRLQRERPEEELPAKRARLDRPRSVVTVMDSHARGGQEQEEAEAKLDAAVASKLWGKVLDTSRDRKEEREDAYIKNLYEGSGSETEEEVVDYKSMLEEFVLKSLQEQSGGKTLYEQRVDQMMRAPDGEHLVKEFYIAPALVEVLFQKMAQDDTAVESIKRVSEEKDWPEPEYVCKSAGKHGFLYSCILKGKEFTPSKPASNEELAKELAAVECLEWLGFHQKAALGEPPLEQTYFR